MDVHPRVRNGWKADVSSSWWLSPNKAKRSALDAWVKAVNTKSGFGVWCWDVAFDMAKIQDILDLHSAT